MDIRVQSQGGQGPFGARGLYAPLPHWAFASLAVLLTAGAIVLVALLWRRETNLAELRAKAVSAIREARWDEAIHFCRTWAEQFPGTVEPREIQLEAGVRSRRLPVAIEAARAMLRAGPANPELQEKLALWLFLTGELEEADKLCAALRKENPGREGLLLPLHADILQRLGETAKAAELVDQMLLSGGKNPQILTMRGSIYLEEGNYPKAVATLREAKSLSAQPTEKNLHYLALALARNGDTREAEALFAQLRSRQDLEIWDKYGRPDSIPYKVNLVETLIHLGKREEALGILSEIRREAPGNPYLERLATTASAMPAGGGK